MLDSFKLKRDNQAGHLSLQNQTEHGLQFTHSFTLFATEHIALLKLRGLVY